MDDVSTEPLDTAPADPSDGAPERRLPGLVPAVLLLAAVALGIAGGRLAGEGSRTAVTTGILLFVAALGAAAVAVGGRPYGPGREGQPDLSTRIGLGVLGGALAGLAHAALTALVGATGLVALTGAPADLQLTVAEWGNRLLHGISWGLLLGLAWRFVPGRGFLRKGAWFGLVPSAYLLLVRFPFFADAGLFGLGLGVVPVLLLLVANVLAGVVAAAVLEWGGRTAEAPLSRALAT